MIYLGVLKREMSKGGVKQRKEYIKAAEGTVIIAVRSEG